MTIGSIIEPIVIALTVIRIAIDDFYLDIKEELDKVKGKDFGTHLVAFLKGFAEGVVDVLTLGLGRQLRQLDQQREYDMKLLRNLSDPTSYFKTTFRHLNENKGTVDFTAGILSQFGGFLTVKLLENGSFTMDLHEVPTGSGVSRQVIKTFTFKHPINDIVLGVGQVAHPEYIQKEAKLWTLITVKTYDIINRFQTHQSSQYGTYFGNSKSNAFYAVQGNQTTKANNPQAGGDCQPASKLNLQLQSYHYDLYGREGNDSFFLGPQSSHVTGGDGNDMYHIPSNGGKTVINNFAQDEFMDTLYLNVSYLDIFCERDKWDLLIGYCQSHAIKIEKWFSHGAEEFHRHIYMTTGDGVVIEATRTGVSNSQYGTSCAAVSVDKSRSSSSETVTLSGRYSEVKQVVGSNFSDVITGNELPNILNGGLGSDHLKGGNGADTYIVQGDSGIKTIDNFASDNEEDVISIGIPYVNISVNEVQSNLILKDSTDHTSTQVTLSSWFRGPKWQHAIFTSKDYIRFTVMKDATGTVQKHPLTIDLSGYKNGPGVVLDLSYPQRTTYISINSEIADEIKTVFDSPHDDALTGNRLGNFFSCTGGHDFLRGRGGRDTYVIKKSCLGATIVNDDPKGDYDLLLFDCPFASISLAHLQYSLTISCQVKGRHTIEVALVGFLISESHQHLMVKTSDKITSFLPTNQAEFNTNQAHLYPFQVEKNEDCNGGLQKMNLSTPQFSKCERFVAKTSKCCLLYTSPSPRDATLSRMPSSA